ncbi:hypothetical protein ACWJJH_14245 [Endozoicomonadaceae bacterium StTr2]
MPETTSMPDVSTAEPTPPTTSPDHPPVSSQVELPQFKPEEQYLGTVKGIEGLPPRQEYVQQQIQQQYQKQVEEKYQDVDLLTLSRKYDTFNDFSYDFADGMPETPALQGFDIKSKENDAKYTAQIIDPYYQRKFRDINPNSPEQADWLLNKIKGIEKQRDELSQLGVRGDLAAMLSTMNTPGELVATGAQVYLGGAVFSGLGKLMQAGRAARMSYRMNRIARGAASGLTTSALFNGYRLANNDAFTLDDFATYTAAEAGLGGLGGLLPSGYISLVHEVEAGKLTKTAAGIRRAGLMNAAGEWRNPQLAYEKTIDAFGEAKGWKMNALRELEASERTALRDAMEASEREIQQYSEELENARAINSLETPEERAQAMRDLGDRGEDIKFKWWRWDTYANMQKSKSSTARGTGQKIFSDPVDRTGKGMAADLRADTLRMGVPRFMQEYGEKVMKVVRQRKKSFKEVEEHIFDVVEEVDDPWGDDIADLAGVVRKYNKEYSEHMRRSGVKGADEIEATHTYMMRVYDADKVSQKILSGEWSAAQVRSTIRNALESGNPEVAALEDASAVFDRLTDALYSTVSAFGEGGLSVDQILRSAMAAEGRLQKRINLDVMATSSDGRITMKQLLNRNTSAVMTTYINQTSGLTAFAEVGFKNAVDDMALIRRNMESEMRNAGVKDSKIKKTLDQFDDGVDSIFGTSRTRMAREADSDLLAITQGRRRAIQVMTTAASANMLGASGLTALPETLRGLTFMGIGNAIKSMPLIRNASGKDFKVLAEHLDQMGVFMGNPNMRSIVQQAAADSNLDKVIEAVNRTTGNLSLLAFMEKQGRTTAVYGSLDAIAKDFKKFGRVGPKLARYMGLSKEELNTLNTYFRNHAVVDDGGLGNKVMDIRVNSDFEGQRVLATGLQRMVNRTTGRTVVGEEMPLFNKTISGFYFQFLKSSANSWQRVFLYDMANLKDVTVAQSFMFSALGSYVQVQARDYMKASGDRRKMRQWKKRSWFDKDVVLKTANYSAEFGAPFLLYEKMNPFIYMTTGMTLPGQRHQNVNEALLKVPAMDYLLKFAALPKNTLMQSDGRTLDRVKSVLPWQSWYPVPSLYNHYLAN